MLTVGSTRHVDELVAAGFRGAVVVKLATSLRRFGAEPADLDDVLAAIAAAGLAVHAFGLHFPLASGSAAHADDVASWLSLLPPGVRRAREPRRPRQTWQSCVVATLTVACRARVGTALWHGDRSPLRLGVDVLDRRPLGAGERARLPAGRLRARDGPATS